MAVWYFGKPEIPVTGLVLAFGALIVPVVGTFAFPESSRDYEVLLWLLALVPAFLLAYYRGWMGVALSMLIGMVVLSLVQVAVILLQLSTDWALLLGVVAAYVSIGLSLGLVSELLHQERAKAESLALLDDLTGIPNRRLADLFIGKEFAAAQRGRGLAVVLFDIDRFKAYNDLHGHAAGDAALRHFVAILSQNTRRMDISARYGGEEFITVLSGGSAEAGKRFAENVRAMLAEPTGPSGEAARIPPFTVSAGVAAYEASMSGPDALVQAADVALYRAKADGRDRVRVHAEAAHRSP